MYRYVKRRTLATRDLETVDVNTGVEHTGTGVGEGGPDCQVLRWVREEEYATATPGTAHLGRLCARSDSTRDQTFDFGAS